MSHSNFDHLAAPSSVPLNFVAAFETLFAYNQLAIGMFDINLRFFKTSQQFCDLLSSPREKLLGSNILELSLKGHHHFANALNRLANAETRSFEWNDQIILDESPNKHLQLKLSGLYEDDRFVGGLIILEDQTNEIQIQNQLRRNIYQISLEKLDLQKQVATANPITHFAHMASHDMKEPLRMIRNFVRMLEKRNAAHFDEVSREYMQFVLDGTENINQLVVDLLNFTEVSAKPFRFRSFSCEDLFFLMMQELKPLLLEAGAELQIGEVPQQLVGDRNELKVVFMHLIQNAIKFRQVERPCHIEIEGVDHGRFWQFCVRDNGIGIAEAFHPQIFEVFKRLHSKQDYPGSGLGLASCREIVSKHEGKIWVSSTPGIGSQFHFTISKGLKA